MRRVLKYIDKQTGTHYLLSFPDLLDFARVRTRRWLVVLSPSPEARHVGAKAVLPTYQVGARFSWSNR